MKIKELIKYLDIVKVNYNGLEDLEITEIFTDSRTVNDDKGTDKTGSVFFAYAGESYDSNKDIENIVELKKAKFIICEKELSDNYAYAVVSSGKNDLANAYIAFYGDPLKEYKSVAVTGTNGKTTTSYIMDSIYNANHEKSVRIGTTGLKIDCEFIELDNTTPSPYIVYNNLRRGLVQGCKDLVMEVSSHALAQNRLGKIKFDAAIFTNLTGDHLDFHKSMEEYFAAKAKLFTDEYSVHKVINISHEYGKKLVEKIKSENGHNIITFSVDDKNADIYPLEYESTVHGIKSKISCNGEVIEIHSTLIGLYNLENILGAIGAAKAIGINLEVIKKGIESLENVPGRLEKYKNKNIVAFVDYAHTDDALVNAITSLKQIAKGKIITVFGAGGDRDKTKRPRMAKAATSLSDITIITSDNPRTENPEEIIADVEKGVVENSVYYKEVDREKAIKKAVEVAKENDIIFIAGKGHENYQIIGTTKHHFNDGETVQKYLNEL